MVSRERARKLLVKKKEKCNCKTLNICKHYNSFKLKEIKLAFCDSVKTGWSKSVVKT